MHVQGDGAAAAHAFHRRNPIGARDIDELTEIGVLRLQVSINLRRSRGVLLQSKASVHRGVAGLGGKVIGVDFGRRHAQLHGVHVHRLRQVFPADAQIVAIDSSIQSGLRGGALRVHVSRKPSADIHSRIEGHPRSGSQPGNFLNGDIGSIELQIELSRRGLHIHRASDVQRSFAQFQIAFADAQPGAFIGHGVVG